MILKTIIELSKDGFVAVCFIGICILVLSGIVGIMILILFSDVLGKWLDKLFNGDDK